MRYKVFNPNRFMVPVMVKEGNSFNQINIQPKATIEVDSNQVSDSLKNLASEPRNVLRMTRVVEERNPVRKRVLNSSSNSNKNFQKDVEKKTADSVQKVISVQGKNDNGGKDNKDKKNGGGK